MKIRTKILVTLLGMSMLVALVGALAVNRERASALIAARKEAEDVARVLTFLMSDPTRWIASIQEVVTKLHRTQGRDVVLVDAQQHVLADANPAEIGDTYHSDPLDEVGSTINDRKVRTFVEVSAEYPAGIKQIAVPIEAEGGQVIGAVILEYTPLYDEMIRVTMITLRQVAMFGLGSAILSIWLAFYMGRSIGEPLRQLTNAATGFAGGRTDLPMPSSRGDEIGALAMAFNSMRDRRKEAAEAVQRIRDELEARVVERTAELNRQQTELRVLFDLMPAMIWFKDTKNRILRINKGAAEAAGKSVEEIEARLSPGRGPQESEKSYADDLEVIRSGAPKLGVVETIPGPEGNELWIHTDKVPVHDDHGAVTGIVIMAQDITERKLVEASLEKAHRQLLETSRQAGMAEVATSVLHNVGNVLNSVNVSCSVISDKIRRSRVSSVAKTAALLCANRGRLAEFFTSDPTGQKLPHFMAKLAERLAGEQESMLGELQSLGKNIDHIKDVVAVQQSYAKNVGGVRETLPVTSLVEDALRMCDPALTRHGVEILREYGDAPAAPLEKHKVLQILVNLVRNAKHALTDSGHADKRLVVRVCRRDDRIVVSVIDNGIGISLENMTRIFAHGFTTKKDGHGFGLHSGVLAAQEMGGSLTAYSEGLGTGATFTLELPLDANARH